MLEDSHEHVVSVEEEAVMVESDAFLRSAQEAVYRASLEKVHATERSLEQLENTTKSLGARSGENVNSSNHNALSPNHPESQFPYPEQ